MKTQDYFTYQIKTLFFIMAIATFSTFGIMHSALKTSSLQFGETQINKDKKNNEMNALAAINNTPVKEKMFPFLKNADSIPKRVSQDDQFPLYVPFYFFSLGFILVLAHRSIMHQNPGNKKVKDVHLFPLSKQAL
jgi:hypothetical protein